MSEEKKPTKPESFLTFLEHRAYKQPEEKSLEARTDMTELEQKLLVFTISENGHDYSLNPHQETSPEFHKTMHDIVRAYITTLGECVRKTPQTTEEAQQKYGYIPEHTIKNDVIQNKKGHVTGFRMDIPLITERMRLTSLERGGFVRRYHVEKSTTKTTTIRIKEAQDSQPITIIENHQPQGHESYFATLETLRLYDAHQKLPTS